MTAMISTLHVTSPHMSFGHPHHPEHHPLTILHLPFFIRVHVSLHVPQKLQTRKRENPFGITSSVGLIASKDWEGRQFCTRSLSFHLNPCDSRQLARNFKLHSGSHMMKWGVTAWDEGNRHPTSTKSRNESFPFSAANT